MLMPSFFGRCLDRWANGLCGTAVAAVMMPWNEGQVTTTIAETGAPWPVNASNPDFLHNPAVVQQSTETVHTVCEGDRPHWSSWDVTVMAREWAAGSLGNNGVILWATNEAVNGRDLRFAARETTNATIRPVLQVAYGAGTGLDADCSMFDDWSNVCAPDTTQPSTAVPTSPTSAAPMSPPTPTPTPSPTVPPTPAPNPAPTPVATTEPPDNITVYAAVQDALLERSDRTMGTEDFLIVAKHTGYPLSKGHSNTLALEPMQAKRDTGS
jgi:cell division septation protein DedD